MHSGQQERVHWTGLHRLLDSTAGMVSMTRTGMPGQQERGRKTQRECKNLGSGLGLGLGKLLSDDPGGRTRVDGRLELGLGFRCASRCQGRGVLEPNVVGLAAEC